jgi:hypothetical protein
MTHLRTRQAGNLDALDEFTLRHRTIAAADCALPPAASPRSQSSSHRKRLERTRKKPKRLRRRFARWNGIIERMTASTSPIWRRPRPRTWAILLAASCALVFSFYLVLYPLRGIRFPIGSDAPVYTWWSRIASVGGLGAAGGQRPGIVGAFASILNITHLPAGAIMGSIGPVLALVTALATAALVGLALGWDAYRFGLAVVVTAVFLSPLVAGYFSNLAFGACLVAATACIVDCVDRPGLASGLLAAGLVGAAGLTHPARMALGGSVLLCGVAALIPSSRRARRLGAPWLRTPSALAVAPLLGGVAVSLGMIAPIWVGRSPPLDVSLDGALSRVGLGWEERWRDNNSLYLALPSFTGLALGAALVADHIDSGFRDSVRQDGRVFFWGVIVGWFLLTLAAIAAVVTHHSIPAHRMMFFCLPVPIVFSVGAARRLRSGPPPSGRFRFRNPPWPLMITTFAIILFIAMGWFTWRDEGPTLSAAQAAELATVGRFISMQPVHAPLIFVTDDPEALLTTSSANLMREAVPPQRARDVYVFAGRPQDLLAHRPTLDGVVTHDAVAKDYWERIRPLLGDAPVAVALSAFDPAAYRATMAMPGSRLAATGVAVLPGFAGSPVSARISGEGSTQIGVEPVSPWLTVVTAPALLLFLGVLGLPLVFACFRRRGLITHLALAPAVGLGTLSLASVALDAAGLRLGGAGGQIAPLLALVVGLGFLWCAVRSRRADGLEREGDSEGLLLSAKRPELHPDD